MDKLNQFLQFTPKEDSFTERKSAIVYTRVSTKEQADTNTSLTTQKKHCELYAKNNGHNIIAYFGGTHESAKSDDRREFKRMIKFAKQSNSVGYIIVYSYDRFSRTGSSASQITSELLKYGVQVKAVTQEVDTLTPSGKFQQNLFYMFSQFDNELRRDKTITAMTELLRKGYWLWNPPRGYKNVNKHHKAVDWKIEITEEGKLLKKAFQWKVKGKYSTAQISKKLALLGMNINEKRLLVIFKNPFYCGILVGKLIPGEVIEGRHPKIVSQEDFLKINSVVSNHPKKHIQGSEQLPLKQFAICHGCKGPLTGYEVKAKALFYYKCKTEGCPCSKSAKSLHQMFQEELVSLEVNTSFHDIIREVMIHAYDSSTHEIRENETQVKKQISESKNKLLALEERFALGEIDKELYLKFAKKYTDEVVQFEQEILNPGLSSSNLQKAINKALLLSQNLSEIWVSGDLEQKVDIQKLVFPAGIGYDKQTDKVLTFRTNSLFAAMPLIARDLHSQKSGKPINYDQFSALVTPAGF
jgi:site-specific DNA recombinase